MSGLQWAACDHFFFPGHSLGYGARGFVVACPCARDLRLNASSLNPQGLKPLDLYRRNISGGFPKNRGPLIEYP